MSEAENNFPGLTFTDGEYDSQKILDHIKYDMVEWQNNKTRLNADNMNHMDEYIEYLSNVTSYLSNLGIQLDNRIRVDIQTISNTIDALSDRVSNCEGGINTVSGRVYNCEGGINTLNTNLYNLTQNVNNNYYNKSEIDAMISSVENALHQMNTGDEVVE